MMNRLAILVLLVLGRQNSLWADNAGPCSAVLFEKQSAAVVVGRILSGTRGGETLSLQVSVNRVLKGDIAPGSVLAVQWRSFRSSPPGPVRPLPEGLWFLQPAQGGGFTVLPVLGGMIPLGAVFYLVPAGAPPPVYQYSSQTPVLDKIAMELAWAAEHLDQVPLQVMALPKVMRGYDSPVLRTIYGRFSQSQVPRLRVTGLAGMIRFKDWAALAKVADEIQTLRQAPNFPEIEDALMTVRDPSPEVIRTMARIGLAGPCTGTERACGDRRTVLLLMADVHSRETLPFLAAMLDDKDPFHRRQAVRGFTLFVGNYPIATPERVASGESIRRQTPSKYETEETRLHYHAGEFKDAQHESRIVAFWKSWWARNQVELTREP
ncbi:MAG: hypothetical protein ACKV22_41540 [Bryobacteraceae bacterium]